jgi:metal-responsive CopG/Arc/MetJ family transcriptional regulator
MKTAISIPDSVYESAEKLAQRLGTSRSKLYTQALSNYLIQYEKQGITEKLNTVYAGNDAAVDDALAHMQSSSLAKETW